MSLDLIKTATYLTIHLTVGFTVAYVMTGSLALAGGIALIEPMINAVAFFFHEKAWKSVTMSVPPASDRRWPRDQARFA
ncbi:MAG: hypothetical protein CMN59_06755 [Sphingobium sp.]|uniref:DUF2061 domain-containing protein n=1 Tax=Sphingobium soli TaxID=1591116 RepID=A0ABS8GZL1_9SPHN|nr:DUF2061 domain-containing protein [Sphingobium soli]MAX15178.1 hypothetical protein [Sphingobium sp.]MCC4231538.1 DUF2061 domain-containing protein [Sphingobium soli]